MKNNEVTLFSQLVKYEGEDVWIKPFCDFFGISYKWQVEVLKKDYILASMVRKNSSELLFGDKRERVLLPKKGFVRWIQIINPSTVDPELRPNFQFFQETVLDYLYGSSEEHDQAKINYNRLHKLERLYSKIGQEIKRVKSALQEHWNSRYLQTSMDFNDKKQLN